MRLPLASLLISLSLPMMAHAGEVTHEAIGTDVQPYAARIGEKTFAEDQCRDIHFTVIMPKKAFDASVFKGIGFYANFAIDNSQGDLARNPFFAKSELTPNSTILASGQPGLFFSFSGRGLCGSGPAGQSPKFAEFKPYAKFEFVDGHQTRQIYKNWSPGANSWVGVRNENGQTKTQRYFENAYLIE